LTDDILPYLAGFFDGEGGVAIKKYQSAKYPYGYYEIYVYVANTNRESVQMWRDYFGFGSVVQQRDSNPRARPCYRWDTGARQAREVLHKLLPYLHIKRERALIALQVQDLKRYRYPGYHMSPEDMKTSEEGYQRMKVLNRKGLTIEA
jgi:hypothetical protein